MKTTAHGGDFRVNTEEIRVVPRPRRNPVVRSSLPHCYSLEHRGALPKNALLYFRAPSLRRTACFTQSFRRITNEFRCFNNVIQKRNCRNTLYRAPEPLCNTSFVHFSLRRGAYRTFANLSDTARPHSSLCRTTVAPPHATALVHFSLAPPPPSHTAACVPFVPARRTNDKRGRSRKGSARAGEA